MLNGELIKTYFTEYLASNPVDLLAFLSCFIPFIVCILYFNLAWQKSKILVIYVFLSVFLELIGGLYAANSKNSHLIYLLFFFLETICLSIFYIQAVNIKNYRIFVCIIISIILAAILYNIFSTSHQINDYSISTQSIGFISISILSFYIILSKSKISELSNSLLFWINTGSILYFSGILFVFLYVTKVLDPANKHLVGLYDIISFSLIIFRTLIAIGIVKSKDNDPITHVKYGA